MSTNLVKRNKEPHGLPFYILYPVFDCLPMSVNDLTLPDYFA